MALKDNYVTITQAAKQLGVTRQTISRWLAKGKVPGEKIGRETLIKKKDLHKYHIMKLTDTATDSIMELYTATVAYVLRGEGRIQPNQHVEFPEDGDDKVVHLSDEEKDKVNSIMKPLLVEILKELDSKVKDNLPKKKQGGKKSK